MSVKEILENGSNEDKKALFSFTKADTDIKVWYKYQLWARKFFPKYFSSKDALFHKEIDLANIGIYRNTTPEPSFVNIAFRGAAKTARTKLLVAFCISSDMDHFRKYFKVYSEDGNNSVQIVTDVYNMLVNPEIKEIYPEIFEKTTTKREERQSSFTTSTGVKMTADTVGAGGGRGALQEEARPDFVWFEDFENKKTLYSGRLTMKIWDNMEEARTGLAYGGRCIYTCNYTSEQGNVHRLVSMPEKVRRLLIQPIEDEQGNPTWERYTKDDIQMMRETDDDFEGERMCKPSASKEVFFDRESIDKQIPKQPYRVASDFRMYKQYDPSHRYGSGHDISGGVGLDSSTSVFWDFTQFPAQVVATYDSNTIRPSVFGDEIYRQLDFYGMPICAPEVNYGTEVISRLKDLDANLYVRPTNPLKVQAAVQSMQVKEYGFHTNSSTKNTALFALAKAVYDGHVELNDPKLIAECRNYTRNDLLTTEKDPRNTTRHFDLLMAAAIGYQMKDHAQVAEEKIDFIEEAEEVLYPQIGM